MASFSRSLKSNGNCLELQILIHLFAGNLEPKFGLNGKNVVKCIIEIKDGRFEPKMPNF